MAMRKLKNQHRIVYNWKSQHFVAGTSGSRNIGTTDYKSSRCIPTSQKRRISASKLGKVNIYIVLYIACNYLFTKRQIVSSYNRKYFYLFGCFRCFGPPKLNWRQKMIIKYIMPILSWSDVWVFTVGYQPTTKAGTVYTSGYVVYIITICVPEEINWWGPRLNIKTVFPDTWIPMLKIRRSWGRHIFNIGIPILVRRHLYIKTAPRVAVTSSTLSTLF